MGTAEVIGIAALAAVVVREAFAMLRWMQARRNNNHGKGNPGHSSPETAARFDGIDSHLTAIDAELVRIRDRQHELNNAVAIIKGQWEMQKRERE